MNEDELELGLRFAPQFNDQGLIPCITVDDRDGDVLMFAWMNREALQRTLETGRATYFSRSRQTLWVKGESSGRWQEVRRLLTDCDQDVIQLRVVPQEEGSCHRGYRSCFYRAVSEEDPQQLEFVESGPVFDPDEVYSAQKQKSK